MRHLSLCVTIQARAITGSEVVQAEGNHPPVRPHHMDTTPANAVKVEAQGIPKGHCRKRETLLCPGLCQKPAEAIGAGRIACVVSVRASCAPAGTGRFPALGAALPMQGYKLFGLARAVLR